jgi:hypothetical protein
VSGAAAAPFAAVDDRSGPVTSVIREGGTNPKSESRNLKQTRIIETAMIETIASGLGVSGI